MITPIHNQLLLRKAGRPRCGLEATGCWNSLLLSFLIHQNPFLQEGCLSCKQGTAVLWVYEITFNNPNLTKQLVARRFYSLWFMKLCGTFFLWDFFFFFFLLMQLQTSIGVQTFDILCDHNIQFNFFPWAIAPNTIHRLQYHSHYLLPFREHLFLVMQQINSF